MSEMSPHGPHNSPSEGSSGCQPDEAAWTFIRQALEGLRYGEVTVIVQDGVIIQVERTERTRPRQGESKRSAG